MGNAFNSGSRRGRMGKIANPHDRFFKEVFSDKERAIDFLANFLPSELAELVDLASIKISKDSFIDEEFREAFSDLLYEVEFARSTGYIYILFEHKSHPERYTALQLLKYMTRIWDLHLRQSPKPELPIILPLVLYQGVEAWRFGSALRDIQDVQGADRLLPYTPDFRYLLCDLSAYSDEQIRGGVIFRAMTLAMKYALREDLQEKFFDIIELLATLADKRKGLECLELLFRYLAQASDKVTGEAFQEAAARIQEGDDIVPTLAEQWFQEGLEKGKLQGKLEGKQEGMLSAVRDVILEIIEARYGVASQRLVGKLNRIQSYEVLRMLHRQLNKCDEIVEFEKLVDRAL
jgi:predicted transposase/invertase (TIGR01784 family)